MGNVFYFPWEFDVLYWFQSLHHPVTDKLMLGITTLGNAGIFWIVLSLFMLFYCRDKRVGLTAVVSLLLSLLIVNFVLKNSVARVRPCQIDTSVPLLIKSPKDYSFPSGHTSASFAAAVSIVQYAAYRRQGIAAILLASMIAVSRMYLFVHFPTDILAGVFLGVLEGIVSGYIVRFVINKRKISN